MATQQKGTIGNQHLSLLRFLTKKEEIFWNQRVLGNPSENKAQWFFPFVIKIWTSFNHLKHSLQIMRIILLIVYFLFFKGTISFYVIPPEFIMDVFKNSEKHWFRYIKAFIHSAMKKIFTQSYPCSVPSKLIHIGNGYVWGCTLPLDWNYNTLFHSHQDLLSLCHKVRGGVFVFFLQLVSLFLQRHKKDSNKKAHIGHWSLF